MPFAFREMRLRLNGSVQFSETYTVVKQVGSAGFISLAWSFHANFSPTIPVRDVLESCNRETLANFTDSTAIK